jgi:uncharacterized glyoxalase superfamily protein PhnB
MHFGAVLSARHYGLVVLPERISMVTLGVNDMSRMRAFYRSLGWTERADANDTHSMFHLAGAFLGLYPIDLLAEDAGATTDQVLGGFRGITLSINVETREAVDAALDRAREAGAEIVKEAIDATWGGRSGYFQDPEGIRWEVAWAPGAVFDERGTMIDF